MTEASAAAEDADQSGDAASIPQPDPTKRIIMSLDEFGAAKRVFKAHGNTAATMVKRADEALYEAKQHGRNRVALERGPA